ncbi:hypothetical protein PPYR_03433 [Photinus pyralis]|uniref:YTH domain-containing protein n=1 Tax=Photinus pyralis TaxID=7054 RepID=A0A1Y1N504_PHOPY|nr:3'-5' RNA helicase YTHDC2-like [Photinus pyralis]KAB0791633.1 hypothetical protein PPYR_03433 [Photinus pyralis]
MELNLDISTYTKFENLDASIEQCDQVETPPETENLSGSFTSLRLDGQVQVLPPVRNINEQQYRHLLPTWSKRDEFLTTVSQHSTTAVISEPGSDRSTQFPQYILEQMRAERRPCKIIFSQPHRLVAFALAERVSMERGEALGNTVGYQMPLESSYGLSVALTYCTNAILMKTLMNRHPDYFLQVTHIFVDDIQDEDKFLLRCLKSLHHHHGSLKIVLMGYKSHVERAQFFFDDIGEVHVPGRQGGLKPLYLAEILKEISLPFGCDDHYDPGQINYELIAKLIDLIFHGNRGTTLVILPSYEEIVACRESLIKMITFDLNHLQFVTLHSNMSIHEYQNARKSIRDMFQVILAESFVESGCVALDIVYVIDCGREVRRVYNNATRTTDFNCGWITREQSNQRAAIGNNQLCFHLCAEECLDLAAEYDGPPLHEICLQASNLQCEFYNVSEYFAFTFRNAVPDLIRLGAMNKRGKITPLGRMLAQFPCEPRLAKMLCYGVVLKCLDPVLSIVAFLFYKNPFQDQALEREGLDVVLGMAGNHLSDHLVLLRMFQQWQNRKAKHTTCNSNNFVNWHIVEVVHQFRTQFLSQLRGLGFVTTYGDNAIKEVNVNSSNWALIKTALAAGYTGRIMTSEQEIKYGKYSALTANAVSNLGRQVCVIYEKLDNNKVDVASVVTPITVALVDHSVRMKPLTASRSCDDVLHAFSNIIHFSYLFREVIAKKICSPFLKLNNFEARILQYGCKIISDEEVEVFGNGPSCVGTVPKSFSNLIPKSAVQLVMAPPFRATEERASVYFVIKPPSLEVIPRTATSSNWRFAPKTEKRMFPHFRNGRDVILFFTADKFDYFQGIAQLTETNNGDVTQPCRILWLSSVRVSFDLIKQQKIRNSFNDHKLVCNAEDGDEVEFWCAQKFRALFYN